jgi:hypothetical protein
VTTDKLCTPPDPDDPILTAHDSLNPYRVSLGQLFRRIAWDLNPRSWRSARNLSSCRGTGDKQGKKAVILCNGPSLNNVDFDLLEKVFIFGLNKINLIFPRTSMRPDAIVSVNSFVIEQNKSFFETTDIPLYLDYRFSNSFSTKGNRTFLYTNAKGFARDVFWGVDTGNTVTYVALQLAFHMGFTDVALVGCDHSFAQTGPENKVITADGEDPSHFDPNYFSGGVKWQLPDLFKSEFAYMTAKKHFEAHGRKLVNCTKGGRLEIFPRETLETWVDQK